MYTAKSVAKEIMEIGIEAEFTGWDEIWAFIECQYTAIVPTKEFCRETYCALICMRGF